MKLFRLSCLIILVPLTLQYCDSTQNPVPCTAEFKGYSVVVLNPNGEPADSVEVQVTNEETAHTYKVCSEEQNVCSGGFNGRYTIMHDGFFGKISTEGVDLLVNGKKGQLQFRAEYTFRSGECHIQKLAGPD